MESYRSLAAWQRAHEAVLTALRASDQHYQPRARAIFDQLRRAIISIEANIVEGYALRTPLLFRKHLRIALGSAAEAECLVRVCGELEYLPLDTIKGLQGLLDGTIRTLVGFLRKPVR
jgi:four helix bundle protein